MRLDVNFSKLRTLCLHSHCIVILFNYPALVEMLSSSTFSYRIYECTVLYNDLGQTAVARHSADLDLSSKTDCVP